MSQLFDDISLRNFAVGHSLASMVSLSSYGFLRARKFRQIPLKPFVDPREGRQHLRPAGSRTSLRLTPSCAPSLELQTDACVIDADADQRLHAAQRTRRAKTLSLARERVPSFTSTWFRRKSFRQTPTSVSSRARAAVQRSMPGRTLAPRRPTNLRERGRGDFPGPCFASC